MGLHPSDVLESPAAYVALQYLVGGTKMREWGLEALAAKPGERILDLGCGPAYYVNRLGDVDYIGFDTHAPYIEAAKKRFPRARFYCELFGAKQAEALGPFDAVFLMGLLHHLEDEQVDELLGLAAAHLRPGGRVVALDTVVYPGQSAISRTLAKNDRGLRAFVPVHDPALVDELWSAPIDSTHDVVLRGTPGYGQPEVPLRARIAARVTTQFGRTIRLEVGSFVVAISDRSPLPIHPSFWSELGLRARDADLIVQKNFFHYRMFYLATSFQHIPVVSSGATSLERVKNLPHRVPMHPKDRVADWRASDPILRRGRESAAVKARAQAAAEA